jgi:ABC-type multidrug transport system ATPase subunit
MEKTTKIEASGIGKKFFHNWIFRNLSFKATVGEMLLITGANGSGKSTLLKMLSTQVSPTEGKISLTINDRITDPAESYLHLSWSAPWISLYDNFTVEEAVDMHFRFKKNLAGSNKDILERVKLSKKKDLQVRHLSSGMQLRLKSGLAILSASSLLLLDEPTANLDRENSEWLFSLLEEFRKGRIVIFASNTQAEFDRFSRRLDLDKVS